jgi:hypothetical protein
LEQVEDSTRRTLQALANLAASLNDSYREMMKAQSRRTWVLGAAVFMVNLFTTLMMTKLV